MRSRFALTALALCLVAGLVGCGEEAAGPASSLDPPALPPAETMQFDFGFFDAAQVSADGSQVLAAADADALKLNWLNAAVRVAYINVGVLTVLTPPTLAFQLAVHTRPIVEADGTFLWTYTWREDDGREVVVHLRGRIDGVRVRWSLRVTDDGAVPPLDEFLWFSGESGLVDNTGYWIFRDIGDGDGFEAARIDWDQRDRENSLLALEIIDPGSEEYRDTLTYRHVDDVISVEFYDASKELPADITWNERTGTGSLQVPDYLDGRRACWDEYQRDVECGDGAN